MAFKLADLFVSITGDSGALNRTLGGVKGQLLAMSAVGKQATGSLLGQFGKLGGAAAEFGEIGTLAIEGGIFWALFKCVQAAGDLRGALAKVSGTFGTAGEKVKARAEELEKSLGIDPSEYMKGAAGIGLFAQQMGVGAKESAELSMQLQEMAINLAAFSKGSVTVEQASEAIQRGLEGQTRGLKTLGININDHMVKQRALAMGYRTIGGEITEEAKAMATAALIQEKGAYADGARAASMGSFGTQLGILGTNFKEVMEEIGAIAEPIFTGLLKSINFVVGGLLEMVRWLHKGLDAVRAYFGLAPDKSKEEAKNEATDQRIAENTATTKASDQAALMAQNQPKFYQGGIAEFAKHIQESVFNSKDALAKRQADLMQQQLAVARETLSTLKGKAITPKAVAI